MWDVAARCKEGAMRQIGASYQPPSMIALEERLHRLEHLVATLADAVTALAEALEEAQVAAAPEAAAAGRRVREVLGDRA